MNELDHASLEASKKLVDNGIVLDTECYWCRLHDWDKYELKSADYASFCDDSYPAPCFTEVWRELPATIEIDGETYNLCCHKIGGVNCAEYVSDLPETVGSVYGVNMADNLIELLVWVKGAGK